MSLLRQGRMTVAWFDDVVTVVDLPGCMLYFRKLELFSRFGIVSLYHGFVNVGYSI
jgi:hypothetical protein